MIKKASALLIITVLLMGYNNAIAETILIANKLVSTTSLNKNEVKRIFLGKQKKWASGVRIKPVTLKNGAVHDEFVKKFINKTPYSFSSFWKRAIVSGIGIPPKSYKSEDDIVKYVSITKGALGYISGTTPHNGVKVLSIK